MAKVRLDVLLVERGLVDSRSLAQRMVMAGQVRADGQVMIKPADKVDEKAELTIDQGPKYVSRGGEKLEAALTAFGLADLKGKVCADVGASTGGFTDCLLQHGAAQVTGVDVGHGQLHEKIRSDPRVRAIEKLNARELTAAQVGDGFDIVTGDLSFISLTLVLPALAPLPKPGGDLLLLVKPQFELQPGQVGKGGIVTDASLYAVVERRIRDCCEALGLQVRGWHDSAIAGGDGNREFFVHATTRT